MPDAASTYTSSLREHGSDVERPLSVLAKADHLLTAFADGAMSLGLTELSRRSGVAKGSVHRIAQELVQLGYLGRTPTGYELGWRIFELGRLVPGPAVLREVARPGMQDLRAATKAVVHLSVAQGTDVVYIERFAGRRELAIARAVGDRTEVYNTPSGWVLLAFANDQVVDAVEETAREAIGAVNRMQLNRHLADIRQRRYAEDHAILKGFKSYAVPVPHLGGDQVIAALSATVAADRRDDVQLRHALWTAAQEISKGFRAMTHSKRLPGRAAE